VCTCVIFASGNIVLVNEDPEPIVEIVGCIDAGISAASWSPDEEVLAIATHAPSLLLMTREIEPIEEKPFMEDDLKASKHVSVGWGKAETQFRGKHAKAMRDPTVPEKVDQGILSKEDDGSVVISWRGDGEYLAVSSVEKVGNKRAIRCFTREGRLDSVSQPVDGLEAPICWRPSGGLIAGVQRIGSALDIVFFERNGLRHGEFRLDLTFNPQAKVHELQWNCDSSVLAVVFKDRLHFWSTGNYHWYLKQEILIGENGGTKGAVNWHPEQPLNCYIFSPGE
jgi:elongator complex protein 1